MKYLLLAYGDEQLWGNRPTSERDALESARLANDEALWESGHLLLAEGLQNRNAVTTVRVQNGQVSLTDGPLTEAKEHLIGLYVINARDLNEAIHVAANMPQAWGGPIEVRPINSFDEP